LPFFITPTKIPTFEGIKAYLDRLCELPSDSLPPYDELKILLRQLFFRQQVLNNISAAIISEACEQAAIEKIKSNK